ncbi:MAG: DUF7164 domain-containing protein, partial [Cellulosilyticaceae bacterium]
EVSELTMKVGEYIYTNLFQHATTDWPSWFKGVTSMYASEIAVNHLVPEIHIDPSRLDCSSTLTESIHLHPHIHCWHTNELFSKFKFCANDYKRISPDTLNIQKVNEYCLYMALMSRLNL